MSSFTQLLHSVKCKLKQTAKNFKITDGEATYNSRYFTFIINYLKTGNSSRKIINIKKIVELFRYIRNHKSNSSKLLRPYYVHNNKLIVEFWSHCVWTEPLGSIQCTNTFDLRILKYSIKRINNATLQNLLAYTNFLMIQK